MRLNLLLIIVFTFCRQYSWSQLYFPLENYYNGEIERRFVHDSSSADFYRQHLSSKPVLQSRSDPDSLYYSAEKHYYWLTQKLFKENFLVFEGDDFWCAVDPIADLEAGQDFSLDSMNLNLWNTRGIRVQAKFFDKVGFTTSFYETQAFVLDYQAEFFRDHGEFYPIPGSDYYVQYNGVVPGYSRTKSFKTSGFDFAFAEGQVSIEPNRFFNLQFGNGSRFIGYGYRSLLLSDFAPNYPFIKPEINFWKGRVQYSVTYALLQNLYRLPYYTTPEATFERKIGTFHYLDVAVTKNLTIGLFEGSQWRHTDSLGTHPVDWLFANPVLMTNAVLRDTSAGGYNSITGINIGINIWNNLIYGQLVIDNGKPAAYQAGIKMYDLIIPKLDVLVEYNHAGQNTYLSRDKRYNYSHYNLPLAHPCTAGFEELVIRLSYQRNHWFIDNKIVYSARYQNDTMNIGTSIFHPTSTVVLAQFDRSKIFYNTLEIGYRFNKRNNLQAVAGYMFRTDNAPVNERVTNYVYLGIRTRLKNKTLDF